VPAGTYSVIAKLNIQQNSAIADAVTCVLYDPNLDTIDGASQSLPATIGDAETMTMTGLVTMDAGQIKVSCTDSSTTAEVYDIRLTAIHLNSGDRRYRWGLTQRRSPAVPHRASSLPS
jgi:hypothetical protein